MLLHETDAFRGKHVLIIGQGPSRWGVQEATRRLAESCEIVVCNRAWMDIPDAQWCVAADGRQVYGLLRDRAFDRVRLIVPQTELRNWLHQGNEIPVGCDVGRNVFLTGSFDGGTCSGYLALRCAVWGGASDVTLLGIDGSIDNGNPYAGSPGYQPAPTNIARHTVWERSMARFVLTARGMYDHPVRVWMATKYPGAKQPLDEALSGPKVPAGGNYGWADLAEHCALDHSTAGAH